MLDQPLKTALHGWGNQLDPCPCGCRASAMNLGRLMEKGLLGAILPLQAASTTEQVWPDFRHIHPWELALLLGVQPNKSWRPLKLGIAALGQIASPVQAQWILSQYVFHNSDRTVLNWSQPLNEAYGICSMVCSGHGMLVDPQCRPIHVHRTSGLGCKPSNRGS